MISFNIKLNKHINKFLKDVITPVIVNRNVIKHAERGLAALKTATPQNTGVTSESWTYEITPKGVVYHNSNRTNGETGTPIVVLLQYGHATKNGGYVTGLDFVNPALQPIFDQIVKDYWKEVQDL